MPSLPFPTTFAVARVQLKFCNYSNSGFIHNDVHGPLLTFFFTPLSNVHTEYIYTFLFLQSTAGIHYISLSLDIFIWIAVVRYWPIYKWLEHNTPFKIYLNLMKKRRPPSGKKNCKWIRVDGWILRHANREALELATSFYLLKKENTTKWICYRVITQFVGLSIPLCQHFAVKKIIVMIRDTWLYNFIYIYMYTYFISSGSGR